MFRFLSQTYFQYFYPFFSVSSFLVIIECLIHAHVKKHTHTHKFLLSTAFKIEIRLRKKGTNFSELKYECFWEDISHQNLQSHCVKNTPGGLELWQKKITQLCILQLNIINIGLISRNEIHCFIILNIWVGKKHCFTFIVLCMPIAQPI